MSTQIADFYARIGADTDGVKKGFKDTKEGLGDLDKKFREFSTEQTKRAQSWAAVEKQKADAVRAAAKEQEEAARKAAQAEQDAAEKRKASWNMMKRNAIEGAAIITAALYSIKKGYDFTKEGAQLEYTAAKFDRLAQTINTTGEALSGKLQTATKGTLSQLDSMALATDLLSLGLTKNEKDTIRLATVISGLGMNMNQLVLTLANQTTMRFDQLGVSVAGFDDKVKALEKSGMDANAAFTEAFLQQAEAQLKKVGNAADEDIGSFMKFEAAIKDISNAFKQFAAEKLAPDLGAFAFQLTHAKDIFEEMVRLKKSGMGGHAVGFFDLQDLQIMAEANVKAREASAATQVWQERLDYLARSQKEATDATKANNITIDEFNSQMSALDAVIGGEVGNALDDYNSKVADIKNQFLETGHVHGLFRDRVSELVTALKTGSITQKEYGSQLSELQKSYANGTFASNEMTKAINAETEAYNKQTKEMVFNIQQQAIMAAVQSGQIKDAGSASQAVTDLAYSYGLVDDATKRVVDSTNAAISQFAATGNVEVFNQQLRNIEQASQKVAKAEDPLIENTYHVGKRASDATEGLGAFKASQSELASGLNREANPAVHELKNGINGLPPSGTSWSYSFNITTKGSVPKLPSRGSSTGQGFGYNNNAGVDSEFALWSGGQLGNGWTIVGDAPGGVWTPYTEVISPTGYVYSAKEARELRRKGVLGNARAMYFGSGDVALPIPHPAPSPVVQHRSTGNGSDRSTGFTGGGGGGGGGGSNASDAADSAVAGVSQQIAQSIQSSVVSAAVAASQISTAAATQNANQLGQLIGIMQELLGKTASAPAIGQAVQQQSSKFS